MLLNFFLIFVIFEKKVILRLKIIFLSAYLEGIKKFTVGETLRAEYMLARSQTEFVRPVGAVDELEAPHAVD